MKIRGEQVRLLRKKLGLSQTELAQGICTQATVSLIEKNNQLPSMPILFQICERLGVDVADVLETTNNGLTDIFERIDNAVLADDAQLTANLLNTIRIKQLRTGHDKQRYYYFLGMLQLMQQSDPTEALFNFNLALKQFAANETDIYQVMATVAAGIAYLKNGDTSTAEQLAQKATKMTTGQLVGATARQLIALNLKLTQLNRQLDQLAVSLQHGKKAVALCRHFETLFGIDQAFYQLAVTQLTMGDVTAGQQTLRIAESLGIVCQHPKLLSVIRQQQLKLS
ncbi:hypothetical protein FC26_GL000670 [Paucilactobacillus vaccinostercus DSM 20634]|uniref:HTH cro/C1-type domain-containing protein n=1 Tax=Paucilactobacillus vaccinostercus DSM 20634 TaxID=1423813 RepID=A0A0R2A511_9LACO|nr:helix-turn-helix transcriptional regulator [Paucilactobacillus vaccinostercus]KRM60580.1 hypothetical protein FC26_GL000670 [Paucilactobacillus vaccinostercus DSM 20634]